MKNGFAWFASFLSLLLFSACTSDIPNFPWMKNVGAQSFPNSTALFTVNDFGAKGDAVTDCTEAIQQAIDECSAKGGGTVTFAPGVYLIGSLFIKENVNFNVPKGTMLIGSQNLDQYARIDTRVAGIEMNWPSALINVIGQKNVAITGDGVINARGKFCWEKYWEMRKEYVPKGLRWSVDYDCERARGILISDCENVTVKDIVLYQPGFWSLHILYSAHVTVDNIIISNNIEGRGPSTDGVDIDSSSYIEIMNCNINCNDDNFCLKAGRDADGIRVNRPCEYVVIHDCVAGYGDGLFTCGSETSGGIRNIVAYNMVGNGTKNGLRFKSTLQRGGCIEDIYLSNIVLNDVRSPLIVDLNWNPSYSNSILPEGYNPDSIPAHWKKLIEQVPVEVGTPKFQNIVMNNIVATGATVCLKAVGVKGKGTLDNFKFTNVVLSGEKAGEIVNAKNWTFDKFVIMANDSSSLKVSDCEMVNP